MALGKYINVILTWEHYVEDTIARCINMSYINSCHKKGIFVEDKLT
jgi:hypothetical protein